MRSLRFLAFFVCLVATTFAGAQPDYSPRVEPNPGISGQPLHFWMMLPYMTCFSVIASQAVSRDGAIVTVSYVVGPPPVPTGCFTVMPPLTIYPTIGVFAPGDYAVRVVDLTPGSSHAPVVVPFAVLPAAQGESIPTLDRPAMALLVLALIVAAGLTFERKRAA